MGTETLAVDALSINLLAAAAVLALTHTVLGPDHTLPFIMLGQAQRWTSRRTLLVTFLCGLGHVLSSLLLGGIGLALGYGVAHVTKAEAIRGDLAAWALVAFGAAYLVWGVRHAVRTRKGIVPHDHHGHVHLHTQGDHAARPRGPGAVADDVLGAVRRLRSRAPASRSSRSSCCRPAAAAGSWRR